MPVSIKGTNGGSVILDAGSAASVSTLTLPNTSGTVVNTAPGASGNVLISNGSAWESVTPAAKIAQGTAVTLTSQTSVDYTSIPSWVKRITVIFNGVSLGGTSVGLVQLGTSGGVVTSGYAGAASNLGVATSYTAGCGLAQGSAAASTFSGQLTVILITGNTWVFSGAMARSDSAVTMVTGASVALSGTLDRVRLTTVNGTDALDAGTVNILYE